MSVMTWWHSGRVDTQFQGLRVNLELRLLSVPHVLPTFPLGSPVSLPKTHQ